MAQVALINKDLMSKLYYLNPFLSMSLIISFRCLCLSGWYGVHCTKSSATCTSGSTELCGHGICVPQNNAKGYKCICDQVIKGVKKLMIRITIV